MAPQGEIPVAANVLGTIGTVLWSIQLIPQAWTNWRTKSTEGLPASMMFLWALCAVPFGVYAIAQNFNIPIQVQPQAFGILCIINWGQILLYTNKWPLWKVLVVTVGTAGVFGGVEAALVLTIRPIYKSGNETPVIIIGVIAAILLAAGLLPPYAESWKRRGRIIGINFLFLTIDSLGALFSLFSLVAQHTFDVLGGVMYIICIVLELGIFASHLIWLFRTRKVRRDAKAEGRTFDDVLLDCEMRDLPFRFAERKGGVWPWGKNGRGQGQEKNDEEMARGTQENEKRVDEKRGGDEVRGNKEGGNDGDTSGSGLDTEG